MSTPYKRFQHITNGDMSGNISGIAINAAAIDHLDFQCIWTGTPAGTLKVQSSNEETPATWTDLTGMTQAAGGAAGNHVFTVAPATAMWYRIYYAFSGSTGTLQVHAVKKDV